MLEVNKNLKIHPLKLLEIPAASRQAIFDSTKNFANGSLTNKQFHDEMKVFCKEHQIAFESMREETMKKLCQMYGKEKANDIVVGGKKIFANATPHDVDRLRVVLENTMQENSTILEMATEFAQSRGCTSTKDFIILAEYLVADLNDMVRSYETSYQSDLAQAKTKPDFNQATFDKNRGIEGKRVKFHRQKALNQIKNDEGKQELNQRYNTLKSEVGPLNQQCKPGFFSDDSATYHYIKHKHFKTGEITPEQYFQIAEEVVGNPVNKTNSILSQDGSCVMITYKEPVNEVKVIKIDRCGDSGIATVMYEKTLPTNKK